MADADWIIGIEQTAAATITIEIGVAIRIM
jgi:hypothetical protein